jgi:hypothetical protein
MLAMIGGAPATAKPAWLYRPTVDSLVILGPWIFTALFAFAVPGASGQPMAVWLAQFVLGNTTHVILTFLLLGVRPDVLRATPTQARLVAVGSAITFLIAWGIFRAVDALAPAWADFPVAVIGVFGSHHRLSQAKGVWSLYNLRAGQLGYGPPSAAERSLQQLWVSLGLILVMVAWLFVPSGPGRMFPLLQAIPLEPAFLPHSVAYGLAAVWIAFVAVLLRVVARGRLSVPKLAHIASHGGAVAFAILAPAWGAIVWGAIHGLEYYFLCARMMERREGDAVRSPPGWLVWPLMALAMAPIIVVGLAANPFTTAVLTPGPWVREAVLVVNGVVAAHYFADAFIYRFRIPEVRKVALHRLGFA